MKNNRVFIPGVNLLLVDKNATNEHISNLVSSFNNGENIYVNHVPNTSIKKKQKFVYRKIKYLSVYAKKIVMLHEKLRVYIVLDVL